MKNDRSATNERPEQGGEADSGDTLGHRKKSRAAGVSGHQRLNTRNSSQRRDGLQGDFGNLGKIPSS
jgi:hypothetical protein